MHLKQLKLGVIDCGLNSSMFDVGFTDDSLTFVDQICLRIVCRKVIEDGMYSNLFT